jgi:hypothetical protein
MLRFPAMANCPACGSPVTPAVTTDGLLVALETYADTTGRGRYRIIDTKPGDIRAKLTVEQVAPQAHIPAFPDHRLDCPAHGNGLT